MGVRPTVQRPTTSKQIAQELNDRIAAANFKNPAHVGVDKFFCEWHDRNGETHRVEGGEETCRTLGVLLNVHERLTVTWGPIR